MEPGFRLVQFPIRLFDHTVHDVRGSRAFFHQSFQRDRIIHKGHNCLAAPRFTLHGNKPDQMMQAGKDLFQSADRFTRSIISYASKPLCHHTLTDTDPSQLGNSPHERSETVATRNAWCKLLLLGDIHTDFC